MGLSDSLSYFPVKMASSDTIRPVTSDLLDCGRVVTLPLIGSQVLSAGFYDVCHQHAYLLIFQKEFESYVVKSVRLNPATGEQWTARSMACTKEEIDDIWCNFSS